MIVERKWKRRKGGGVYAFFEKENEMGIFSFLFFSFLHFFEREGGWCTIPKFKRLDGILGTQVGVEWNSFAIFSCISEGRKLWNPHKTIGELLDIFLGFHWLGSLISSTLELYPRYFDRFFDDEFFLTIPILCFYFIIFYFLTSKIFSERKNSKLDERAKVIKRSHESNFPGKWIKKKKKSNVYSQNSIKFKS